MASLPLSVEKLAYRYRTREEWALRDISFDVQAGQVLLIAGASGCGKTTLLRCINGLIPRSYKEGELRGTIRLNGQDPTPLSLAQISQSVGTVLQDPDKQIVGSYVYNEVAFGLENLGVPRKEMHERVDAILEYLGISHLKAQETYRLSGGEKQKVTLAGVLVMRPSILLLDEPLAQLDPQSAQDALAMIRRLADEGLAVLVIEHRVEDVLLIHPERALFLDGGQLKYAGDVEGFQRAVDYRQVKLPAQLVMQQVRKNGKERDARREAPENSAARNEKRETSAQVTPVVMPLVQFKNVSFGYEPDKLVLYDISAEIRPGDVIALLGENGAGKSTLVKHAIGLLKPTRGSVIVDGQDTRQTSTAQLAKTLGYVFQSPTQMLFAPTVTEELAFGPRNLKYPQAEIDHGIRRAVEMMNLVGLEQYSPFSLSYGQQKRVSIAAIMAMQSKILAMDEPTAGQDYRNYDSFMSSILALTRFQAILFITHDLDLALVHANRVWLMHAGRIVADGKPSEILAQPGLLKECRLVSTSLLQENLKLFPQTRRFLAAEQLSQFSS